MKKRRKNSFFRFQCVVIVLVFLSSVVFLVNAADNEDIRKSSTKTLESTEELVKLKRDLGVCFNIGYDENGIAIEINTLSRFLPKIFRNKERLSMIDSLNLYETLLDMPIYFPSSTQYPKRFFSGRSIKLVKKDKTNSNNFFPDFITFSKRDKKKINVISTKHVNVSKKKPDYFAFKLPLETETGCYSIEFTEDNKDYSIPVYIQGLTEEELTQEYVEQTEEDPQVSAIYRLLCGPCYWESVLAINPEDENYGFLLGASMDSYLLQTTDGWVTNTPYNINEYVTPGNWYGGDPKFAFTPNNQLAVASLLGVLPVNGGVYVEDAPRSVPPTFSLDYYHSPGSYQHEFVFDYEKIAIDRDPLSPYFGSKYLTVFIFEINGVMGKGFVTIRNGEVTERFLTQDEGFSAAQPNSILVGSGGKIFIGGKTAIDHSVFDSQDGGETFTLHVLPSIRLPRMYCIGKISSISNRAWRIYEGPELAYDKNIGRLYAVWADYRTCIDDSLFEYGRYSDDVDILSSYSDDNGGTWSEYVMVNDDFSGGYQGFPSVAVDENGKLYVAFLDHRDNQDISQFDVYLAHSIDNGQTFSKNIKLNDLSVENANGHRDPGDYLDMIQVGENKIYVSHPCTNLPWDQPGLPDDICVSILNKPLIFEPQTTTSQCSDDIDNDANGFVDYPDDLGCIDKYDNEEIDPNDTTAPTISSVYHAPTFHPTDADTITFTATAYDNYRLSNISIYIDENLIETCNINTPIGTCIHFTSSLSEGNHIYYAIAIDVYGNSAQSTIENLYLEDGTPPVITSGPNAIQITQNSAIIIWETDEAATSEYMYGTSSGSYPYTDFGAIAASHSVLLSGLTPSITYYYVVKSQDNYGNAAFSPENSFTTLGALAYSCVDPDSAGVFPSDTDASFYIKDRVTVTDLSVGIPTYSLFDSCTNLINIREYYCQNPGSSTWSNRDYSCSFGCRNNPEQGKCNQKPSITSFNVNPTSGLTPLTVTFTATATDPDFDTLTYNWNFGDGNSDIGSSVQHAYTVANTYNAILDVSDGYQESLDTRSQVISIDQGDIEAPKVSVSHTPPNPREGQTIKISAGATDNVALDNIKIYIDTVNVQTCPITLGANLIVGKATRRTDADPPAGGLPVTSCEYSTSKLQSGPHTYYATATDNSLNTGQDPLTGTKSFTINVIDVSPPVISNGQPSGVLSSGTTSTLISLVTDESATCKYSTTPGDSYNSMISMFSTTGTTFHSSTVAGLSDGNTYTYYTKCRDIFGNMNTNEYIITFSVDTPPVLGIQFIPPTPSNGQQVINPDVTIKFLVQDTYTDKVTLNFDGANYILPNLMSCNFENTHVCDDSETSTSTTSFTTGKFGQGVLIDGSDSLVYPTLDNIDLSEGTIMFWINPQVEWTANSGSRFQLFQSSIFDGQTNGIIITKAPGTNNVLVSLFTPSTITLLVPASEFPQGVWKHVALTYGPTGVHFYINGVLKSSTTQRGSMARVDANMYLGTDSSLSSQVNSIYDEFKVYSKKLTQSQINTIRDIESGSYYTKFVSLSGGVHTYQAAGTDIGGSSINSELRSFTIGTSLIIDVLSPEIGIFDRIINAIRNFFRG